MGKPRAMTVQQAIDFLSKLPDKDVAMVVDCPYCGHGHQLAWIAEAVILGGESEDSSHAR